MEGLLLDRNSCSEFVRVVGESNYQSAISRVCGSTPGTEVRFECVAGLWPDPENRYDPNAVEVQINGMVVGHLSREDAVAYRPMIDSVMARGLVLVCNASIAGRGAGSETPNRGVFLRLPPPDDHIEFD